MPTAPTAASVISTFMSSEPRRSPARAERAIDQPPTAIDARYSGSATARDAPDSEATTAAASSTSDPDTETVRASRRQNGAGGSGRRRVSGAARYPARATAADTRSGSTSPSTASVALPNDTRAARTPSSAATTFSTVFAHAAQSMPSTR